MPPAETILYDLAAAIRAVAHGGIPEDIRPERTFVAPGPDFAHDCPLVAVHFVDAQTSSARQPTDGAGRQTQRAQSPAARTGLFRVTVVGCVPTGDSTEIPPAAEIDEAAGEILTAQWTARAAVVAAVQAGTLFAGLGEPAESDREIGVTPLIPFGPSGGHAGARFDVMTRF